MIYEVWDHIQKKYGPRKKLEGEELCVGGLHMYVLV